jgi:hypothetical protein
VLTRVTGIGDDWELDEGIGVCGKGGQSVPAGVGQPTLLVDGLTVGGRRCERSETADQHVEGSTDLVIMLGKRQRW